MVAAGPALALAAVTAAAVAAAAAASASAEAKLPVGLEESFYLSTQVTLFFNFPLSGSVCCPELFTLLVSITLAALGSHAAV